MKEYKTLLKEIRLVAEPTAIPNGKIGSSQDANDYIRKFFSDDIGIFESMFILLLNRANNTIGYAKISQGGVAGTVVDPKIIAKYAVEALASGVIICHNHPSGNLNPSLSDDDLTNRIKGGMKFLDIPLLDHLIINDTGDYYSYADEGRL